MDKRYSQYYSLIQVVTILLFAIFLFNPTNGSLLGHQTEVFFRSCSDIFADFLNVMRYISGRDPYFNPTNGFSEKIYPPLSYLILYPFSQLADYANMTLEECWNSKISIASCLCFTLISFWIFWCSILALNNKRGYSILNCFLLNFSFIILYSIERGNLVILSAACVNFYLAYYEASNKVLRYFALTALCISAVLKIYPVLFGFLLLRDKRYRDIIFCLVTGVILTFLPFAFFKNGFSNISQLLYNIGQFNETYGSLSYGYKYGVVNYGILGSKVLKTFIDPDVVIMLSKCVGYTLLIFSLYLVFKIENKWNQIALLACSVILVPTTSWFYTGLYFLPVIVGYFNSTPKYCNSKIAIVMFALLLMPLQIVYRGNINLSHILYNVVLTSFWVYIMIISFIEASKKNKTTIENKSN